MATSTAVLLHSQSITTDASTLGHHAKFNLEAIRRWSSEACEERAKPDRGRADIDVCDILRLFEGFLNNELE